ncbi:GNAT family N-acetyltransferase [Catenovulum sp. SM1970]|uniref:GNAT family N-acetyltransferase n=1 Tax=Marinifaba aquimaris TaxID=2741323 RepID=UPI001574B030|nr:GNAT family N-acetyltransferase [Marinifaba aquimaris]NTS76047.1 GNAT family N-acetyltransferase [Marinifaba aquimaris]
MTIFSYRKAVPADIEEIIAIRLTSTDPSTEKNIQQSYQLYIEKYGEGIVCLQENQIIGFAIVSIKESGLYSLYVKPNFQRLGIGKNLLKKAEAILKQAGAEQIFLAVNKNNDALNFYQKYGWKVKSHRNWVTLHKKTG